MILKNVVYRFALTVITSTLFYGVCLGQNSINKDALDQFLAEAKKSHSDAVVIWKDNKLYGEWLQGHSVFLSS